MGTSKVKRIYKEGVLVAKECTKCHEIKSASEFCKFSENKTDGLKSQCKQCDKQYRKQWHDDNIKALQINAREENYKYLKTIMPICGSGRNKGKINWEESIGIEVPYFICVGKGELKQEYKGELKIRDYKDHKLYFEGVEKGVKTSDFIQGVITKILNIEFRRPDPPKFKIDDTIKDKKRDLTIIYRKYISIGEITPNGNVSTLSGWWYKVRCNKDGYEHWKYSSDLKTRGCPCCSNKIPVSGINTIWDTHRYLVADFGLDEEFAKTHTICTAKKGEFTCKYCGNIKSLLPSQVFYTNSISCICGDGISYPEKLGYGVFSQLPYRFERQYSPDYFNREKSDFYFPDLNLVVEIDGELGHEGGKAFDGNEETLKERIEVDKWKTEQHGKRGIKTIRIDCFESNLKYIKNNILNSELVNYFDFSNIDWIKAEEFALKNIIKEVCDYFNKYEGTTTKDLLEVFPQIKGRNTIYRYLKKGTELGWCNYDPKEESIRNSRRNGGKNKKCYIVIFLNGIICKKESQEFMADYLAVSKYVIRNNSDGKPYKAYRKKNERLNGIRLFTEELFIKEFGEEEFNKL